MNATRDRQRDALQTIFSFFVGLMVLAFIGVGVNTFYEFPEQTYADAEQKLYREAETVNPKSDPTTLTPAQKAEWDRVQAKIESLQKEREAARQIWARNTSIVLVIFATIVMGISLVRSEQLRVLSNGLLLGGVFTMLYGTGWVIFSGSSTARFLVILFALAVTIGLGYLKFVRGRKAEAAVATEPALAGGSAGEAALGGLAARVAALEARQAAAAAALTTGAGAHED
jgi:type VI protein secretion system component VasK